MRLLLTGAGAVAVGTACLCWAAPGHAAPWCGTPAAADRSPNVIAGHPVRVAYVIPADEPDRLDQLAPTIQADAEAIDAWWRREDPTRTVRFDLAPFHCGAQLDLWSVRLPLAGAELASAAGRSTTIVKALSALEVGWLFRKYLVYYDGPVVDPERCGAGGHLDEGPGFAIVFLRACRPVVPSAIVAAHELLHALGAVPSGAPNTCPFPSAHTCDDERDVMFPYASGLPLSSLILDPGRDDYYGHLGSWYDVREADWLVQLDGQVPLRLTVAGSGSVEGDVPGLACSASCGTSWNRGSQLTLTARPAAGVRFQGWGGACSGSGACTLALRAAANAVATFVPRSRQIPTGRRDRLERSPNLPRDARRTPPERAR